MLPIKLNQFKSNQSLQCRGNTDAESEVAFRSIYTDCLMKLRGISWTFFGFKHKTLNVDIHNDLKNEKRL